jgi:hypothetical protein
MATSELSTDTQKYRLDYRDWIRSDEEVIAKIDAIIQALNKKEINAGTVVGGINLGDANAMVHIFGKDGINFCSERLISKWFSLLALLASSESVTGRSFVYGFIKGCSGCMVYTIFTILACFPDQENERFAFDFFRHVLADPKGEILELHEVSQIAQLLDQHIPFRTDGTQMRGLCLPLSNAASYVDKTTYKGQIVVGLWNLVEGLGALCTSESFIKAMKKNSASTIEILKESMKNKTFSKKFVREKWQYI